MFASAVGSRGQRWIETELRHVKAARAAIRGSMTFRGGHLDSLRTPVITTLVRVSHVKDGRAVELSSILL